MDKSPGNGAPSIKLPVWPAVSCGGRWGVVILRKYRLSVDYNDTPFNMRQCPNKKCPESMGRMLNWNHEQKSTSPLYKFPSTKLPDHNRPKSRQHDVVRHCCYFR